MDPLGGDTYQVTYAINLQDNATRGINSFTSAVNKLNTVSTQLQEFANKFNKITTGFNKAFELRVNVGNAMKNLDRVEKKLLRIRELATGVGLKVGGSVVGTSGSSGGGGGAAIVQKPSGRQSSKPTGRPLVAPKSGKPIIPNNIGYRILGPSMIDSGGIGILDMFKGMGVMYGISAVGSAMREVIGQSVEYQNVMQTAKNILKANYKGGNFNNAFGNVERIARDVGVETKFTAVEVADAVKFLAMAGLDLDAISKSIRPIADIALIGDSDLGQTADVMTNIMTAYGIRPDKMRTTADVMTRTFTMSNTTLMEMAESFKYAAPLLSLNNVPFETAAAMIGVLGDAGVKSSQAGTTIRTIMNNLMNPTKKQKDEWARLGIKTRDESGNLRSLNEIFGELNAAREAGKGVDIYKLFRLTATSGAGALMTHVDKWNKIIEENFLSAGLSDKLANEKKNTVAGLWAQLKSAFIEGGLKVFEDNDSNIRNYLRRGISWLKSDEFDKAIRGAVDTVASMGATLLDFTKIVFKFYEKFKPVVDLWLRFQLYAKGVLTILRSMKGVWNILAGFTSSFIAPFTAQTSTPMVAPAIAGYGGYYSTTLGVGGAQPRPNFWQRMAGNPRFAKYGPLSSMAGMGLGYAIGNGFDNDKGGMWGALIGGGLGALAPMLISGPWGWAAAAAIVAVTGIASAATAANRRFREAAETLKDYRRALTDLGIEKVNVDDTESIIQTNLRITSTLLGDENKILEKQAELWERIIKARMGATEEETRHELNAPFQGSEVQQRWLEFREQYNKYIPATFFREDFERYANEGVLERKDFTRNTVSPFSGNLIQTQVGGYVYTDNQGRTIEYPFHDSAYMNRVFALMDALDPENPLVEEARRGLQAELRRATTAEEVWQIASKYKEKYTLTPDWNKSIDDYDEDAIKAIIGTAEYYSLPEVAIPLQDELNNIMDNIARSVAYGDYIKALQNYIEFGTIPEVALLQQHLFELTGSPLLNPKTAIFGTQDWYDKFGWTNEQANKIAAEEVEKKIEHIISVLPEDLIPAYAQFLNRAYWDKLFSGKQEQFRPQWGYFNYALPNKGEENSEYYSGYEVDWERGIFIRKSDKKFAIPGQFNSAILPAGKTNDTEDEEESFDYFSQSMMPPLKTQVVIPYITDDVGNLVAENTTSPVVNIYVDSIMKTDSMTVEDNMDDFMDKFKYAFDAVLNEATAVSGGVYDKGYA